MTLIAHNHDGTKVEWDLGFVSVWFREGSSTATNNHIPTSFRMKPEIKASYPPPDNQSNNIYISLCLCSLVSLAFTLYAYRVLGLGLILAKLSASSLFLLGSIAICLGFFLEFWFSHLNLIQLLYILVALLIVQVCIFKGLEVTIK